MIILKSKDEIEKMRTAGAIAAEVVELVKEAVKPGVSTQELDQIAEAAIRKRGAVPTFVGYLGYKKSLCTSINNEVVHAIPGQKRLQDGDIISIDVGVTHQGFVGDHARTFAVGQIRPDLAKLIADTEEALTRGIEAFRTGQRIGDIGFAVQSFAEAQGYGVVRDFVGHGIGRKMHEEPQVPNFGTQGTGPRFKPGMVLAIEPMLNLGTHLVKVLQDGWTVVTQDGKESAHFEHTVAMTDREVVVLTAC